MKSNASIPDIVTQKEFWNTWIEDCLERENLDESTVRRGEAVLELLRSFELDRPQILEVGCANGWLSAKLAQFGRVTGVDLAGRAIAKAKAKFPHVNFIASDFSQCELPKDYFDVVVSVDTISCVRDQAAFLNRIASLLTANGYLILIAPNKYVWDRTHFIRRSHGEIIVNWPTMSSLKRLLRPYFGIVNSTTILPDGHRGILRLVNSYKFNRLLGFVLPSPYTERLKEKMGFGKSIVIAAKKRA